MNAACHILYHMTRFIPVCTALLCLLVSCTQDTDRYSVPEGFGVSLAVHAPGADSNGTKAPSGDNDYTSIVIYAFSGERLVGYMFDENASGYGSGTRFPVTLAASGPIDFYVILNPKPGFFIIKDSEGQDVSFTHEIPDGLTQTQIKSWRIRKSDTEPEGTWYMPMTNLDGTSLSNRQFTVDASRAWTTIPIDVTRVACRLDVYFRSSDDEFPTPPRSIDDESENTYYRLYRQIDDMTLTVPVSGTAVFNGEINEQEDYSNSPTVPVGDVPFNYANSGFSGGFPDYTDESDVFYSEEYFTKVWTYYLFPNLFGGNNTGVAVPGEDTDRMTALAVNYSRQAARAEYEYHKGNWPWSEDKWVWTEGWESPLLRESGEKILYLPECERNTVISVWCELGHDDADRSFTYTVSDWDETVTVNVPDFN